jgi:hypothetical protein
MIQHKGVVTGYIFQVRVLKDWELDESETGEVIILKKEAILFLDDSQCETLVRQGIVERVNSFQER